MKKIPTLFERDWDGDRGRVTNQVAVVLTPGVLATVKWDGTAVMMRAGILYRRASVKKGRAAPMGFEPVEINETTGKAIGWVPVGNDPADQWHREPPRPDCHGRTFELIGPKVQGNPYDLDRHAYKMHGDAICMPQPPTDFEGLRAFLRDFPHEGIVWWDFSQPVAKIKRKDFGLPWPIPKETSVEL